MKKKIILVSLLIIMTLSSFILLRQNTNKEVKLINNLIVKQQKLDKKLTTEGFTIDKPNIVLNPYEISPLTALIMFETDESVEPIVIVEGKDKHTTYKYTFKSSTKHYLNIYGLYPDKENKVTISYKNISKKFIIKTDKLPKDIIIPTNIESNKSELDNELYFFTPALKGYTTAYDINGDIRWYYKQAAIWKIDKLKNGHLLVSTERAMQPPYYNTGLYEMDLLGKIYNEYSLPGGYHHDYYEMSNGNLLVATDEFENEEGTVEDIVVELNRNTGDIIKKIDLKDILNMEDGKSEDWTEYDWFHNNSLWYDKKTNSITLSGRHKDAVINIDYDTQKLNWIIGDPKNWNKEYQKYFFTPTGDNFEWQWGQHAAMITPEGYVFVLDNGNNKSKIKENYVDAKASYTRGVIYKIDTDNMTIKQIYEYGKSRGSDFYSPYISDVDYIKKNHYIIHSGGIVYKDGIVQNSPAGLIDGVKLNSITVEMKDDKKIFEIELPTNNYRVEKMSLYENDEYKNVTGNYKGTLGNTKINDIKIGIYPFIKNIDKFYNSHNIKITKETDRLVVTGQFLRGTDVKVILNKNYKSNIYNYPVSKKPYTALCVDIFTEEENENGIVVTKNINSEGLNGKYSIYIKIDGRVYNTNEYVKF